MLLLPIGKTHDINDQGRTFTIPPEARRKHMAIFGKSGVGKTT
jgi:type IV secretory pathway VirB4 component